MSTPGAEQQDQQVRRIMHILNQMELRLDEVQQGWEQMVGCNQFEYIINHMIIYNYIYIYNHTFFICNYLFKLMRAMNHQ